jgi:hypothetical protein
MFVFDGKTRRVDVKDALPDVFAVGCEITKIRNYCTRLLMSGRVLSRSHEFVWLLSLG